MLGCLGDENVDLVILRRLRSLGFDVTWIAERELRQLGDPEILTLCFVERRVLLTTDRDHLALSAAASRRGEPCAPVIFWPQGKRRAGEVVERCRLLLAGNNYDSLLGRILFV